MGSRASRIYVIFGTGLISAVFLYAGSMKLLTGPTATYLTLGSIGIESPWLLRVVAIALPVAEVILGLWLLSGLRSTAALLICIAAFSFFLLIAGLVAHNVGWSTPCSCTGSMHGEPVWLAMGRNFVLLCLSVWLYFVAQQNRHPSAAVSDH